jgi:hypothetical protein
LKGEYTTECRADQLRDPPETGILGPMQRLIAISIALLLALAGTAAATKSSGDAQQPAALRLVKSKPITVTGMRFQAGERVRLTASSGSRTRTGFARAGAAGRFLETFDLPYDRCSGLLITANGNEGSRARLKMPGPACPPQL